MLMQVISQLRAKTDILRLQAKQDAQEKSRLQQVNFSICDHVACGLT
jgi:hypothetical protein